MNANYREYQSALEAQQRITDVRSVVAGQFSGIGDILHDLADEFRNTMRCDNESAQRIISASQASVQLLRSASALCQTAEE